MTYNIAVIGPIESVDLVLQVGQGLPDLQFIPLAYEVESETLDLVGRVPESVSTILFTGPVPYRIAEAGQTLKKPSTFVPFTGAALYKELFQLKGTVDLERLSIDTISAAEVSEEYSALGLDASNLYIVHASGERVGEEQFQLHHDAFASGRTSGAITGLKSTYRALLAGGVPCAWMAPPKRVILDTFGRCRLLGVAQRSRSSQIAVGIVEVGDAAQSGLVHKLVSDFALAVDGLVVGLSPVSMMFITTRGILEHYTDSFRKMPLLGKELGRSMAVGIGLGPTAVVAARHAQEAAATAREIGGGSAYVTTADRVVLGPIGFEHLVARRTRVTDPETLRLSAQAHLKPVTIDRIRAALRKNAFDSFTADNLAQALGISMRSAQRLVRRLREVGIVQILGSESLKARGKPKLLYAWVEATEAGSGFSPEKGVIQ